MNHEREVKEDRENTDAKWFSKHAEALTIMVTLIGGFVWVNEKMDSKFDRVDSKFDKVNERLFSVEKDISAIEKDVAVIKAVLSLKGINCPDLAMRKDGKEHGKE